MIILVVLVYVFLMYIQLVPLYKNKDWLDLGVNSSISAFSFVIAALLSLDVKIPSPANTIKDFIIAIFGK